MTEAYLTKSSTAKNKRKSEVASTPKSKKSQLNSKTEEISIEKALNFLQNSNVEIGDVTYNQHQHPTVTTGDEIKRTFHIGGYKYLVFLGKRGIVEDILLKEWDGKKVLNQGVKMNLSKFVVLLHHVEVLNQAMKKIMEGAKDVKSQIHMGSTMYATCNSPFKSISIRIWKTNISGELFPLKDGICLKPKEWQEFIKYGNMMYSERLEIYSHIPCLLQPDKSNHIASTCEECGHSNQTAKGEVNIDIPI